MLVNRKSSMATRPSQSCSVEECSLKVRLLGRGMFVKCKTARQWQVTQVKVDALSMASCQWKAINGKLPKSRLHVKGKFSKSKLKPVSGKPFKPRLIFVNGKEASTTK